MYYIQWEIEKTSKYAVWGKESMIILGVDSPRRIKLFRSKKQASEIIKLACLKKAEVRRY